MITGVDDRLVNEKVVPSLEILSTDQEMLVTISHMSWITPLPLVAQCAQRRCQGLVALWKM